MFVLYDDVIGGPAYVGFPEIKPEDAVQTDVSLITGELRALRFSTAVKDVSEEEPSKTLVQRNCNTTVAELGPAGKWQPSLIHNVIQVGNIHRMQKHPLWLPYSSRGVLSL